MAQAPVRVPLRLMVQFQIASRPLVQVTDAMRVGGQLRGAGTRALDLADGTAELPLFDPDTGQPTGERITVARALAVLFSLARRQTP
jgi:hypothetical protein